MTTVELEPNDRDDILQLLDYALEKKKQEKSDKYNRWNWTMAGYWEIRVPQLKELIKGKKIRNGIYQSSMGSLVGDIERNLDDSNS